MVTDDTLDSGQSCTNTVTSTSVVRAGQNFCFICRDFHFKIARHFKSHIKENSDIAYALSLPAGSATRKKLLDNLRNRGNFEYNRDVLQKGRGQLKVKRRAKKVEYKKYEYCIHCKGMFLRPELWRHEKVLLQTRGTGTSRKKKGAWPSICNPVGMFKHS